ncbi:Ig-like domain-containing protein [Patescibacteria group bacterium]
MKKGHYLALFLAVFIAILIGRAFEHDVLSFNGNSIKLNHITAATIYQSTIDNLVLDFTLPGQGADILNALVFKNIGNANYTNEIKNLNLWLDQGPEGFQGTDIDQQLGSLNYLKIYDTWYINDINLKFDNQIRLFVSVDPFAVLYKPGTIQMQIPIYSDENNNKHFDYGDQGVFLASGKNGPIDVLLTNKYVQNFSRSTDDVLGPKLSIINIFDGGIINTPNFTFDIFARDQGSHKVKVLRILIDDKSYLITRFSDDYHWHFVWENVLDGDYQISLQAEDTWGNSSETEPITVQVRKKFLSTELSEIEIDKDKINSDGIDFATVTISLKNEYNQPIENRAVKLVYAPNMIITNESQATNDAGQYSFEVRAVQPGIKKINIYVDNRMLSTVLINAATSQMFVAAINYGDLIKGSMSSVYYLGGDNKRYVFTNEKVFHSWYDGFSGVKTITDQQLASIPLGGNVTYKPGSRLVKVQTNPKVFSVDKGGVFRWMQDEELVVAFYGEDWASQVEDIPDSFFTDYKMGNPVLNWRDYDMHNLLKQISTINLDKKLF